MKSKSEGQVFLRKNKGGLQYKIKPIKCSF